MNDIYTVSNKLDFILYADDTTLSSPLCSFTHGKNGDVNHISRMINAELSKISDWLAVNKLSLNASKTKFMVFHNYQRTLAENDNPQLMINNTIIEKVNEFNFLGLTIKEFVIWRSHSAKIANKISRTLGVMNRLKRYLPFSAMKMFFRTCNLEYHAGVLNVIEYLNCKSALFAFWQIVNIMHIPSPCLKNLNYLR